LRHIGILVTTATAKYARERVIIFLIAATASSSACAKSSSPPSPGASKSKASQNFVQIKATENIFLGILLAELIGGSEVVVILSFFGIA